MFKQLSTDSFDWGLSIHLGQRSNIFWPHLQFSIITSYQKRLMNKNTWPRMVQKHQKQSISDISENWHFWHFRKLTFSNSFWYIAKLTSSEVLENCQFWYLIKLTFSGKLTFIGKLTLSRKLTFFIFYDILQNWNFLKYSKTDIFWHFYSSIISMRFSDILVCDGFRIKIMN